MLSRGFFQNPKRYGSAAFFCKVIRSSAGMGIIEVVIASAIMSIVGLGITYIITNGMQGAQSVKKRMDATQVQSFISQTLNNAPICNASLLGQPAPVVGASVPTLTFAGTNIDDTANNLFDNGAISILSLKYNSVTVLGSLYAVDVRLQISVQGASTQTVVGGSALQPVDFPLTVTVAGGVITACNPPTVITQNDVTAARAFGVTYTAPATPVFVEVVLTTETMPACAGANEYVWAEVGPTPATMIQVAANGIWNQCKGMASVSFLVPAGYSYQANYVLQSGGFPGFGLIQKWIELPF